MGVAITTANRAAKPKFAVGERGRVSVSSTVPVFPSPVGGFTVRIITLGLIAALALPAFATAAEPKRAPGTETIPADGFGLLSVNVAALWDNPELAGVRKVLLDSKNEIAAKFKKEIGFDLAEIERFTVSVAASPFDRGEESPPVVYITARKALDAPKFAKGLGAVPVADYRKEKPDFDITNVPLDDNQSVVVGRGVMKVWAKLSRLIAPGQKHPRRRSQSPHRIRCIGRRSTGLSGPARRRQWEFRHVPRRSGK